jgi:hypothetical protein
MFLAKLFFAMVVKPYVKVKIPKLISAMGFLIIKRLLMVVISHLLPKDEVNVISKMNGWW